MSLYDVKENRLRLVCSPNDKEKVLNSIEKYPFLHLVDTYIKHTPQVQWLQIIVDSDRLDLDNNFVNEFVKETDYCLGAFEEYDPKFD